MTQAVGPASRSTDHRGQTGISGTGKRIANAMYPGVPSRLLTPALSSYQVSTGQTAPALDKARPPLGRRLIAGVFVVHRRNLSRRRKITPRNVCYEGVSGVSPAKRPERTMQYSRPPSPASRAPTMFCVSHESVVVFGPELPKAAIFCSGLMKPDTHLGENARQIEVSDDQTTSFLFR